MIKIRSYQEGDFQTWFECSKKLFPDYDVYSLENDLRNALNRSSMQIFFAEDGDATVGYCHVSVRQDYVEGASTSPTGYLEAIYVDPNYRNIGLAKTLFKTAEKWASEQGCAEIGSDTWLTDTESQAFHLKLGFLEDDRLVHYIKKI